MEGKRIKGCWLGFEILNILQIWSFTFDESFFKILAFCIEFKDENSFYVIELLIWTLDEVGDSWLGIGILV